MVNLFPKTQTNAISSVPTGDIDGMEKYARFKLTKPFFGFKN